VAADGGRVEVAGVVGGYDERAGLGEIFKAGDLAAKKRVVDQRDDVVADSIQEIHLTLVVATLHDRGGN